MKRLWLLPLALAMNWGQAVHAAETGGGPAGSAQPIRISLRIGTTVLPATLETTATALDFLSLLPLTLELRDYAATEKIADLPRRLSTNGAPAGVDPSVGDISYYSPWGNLAIFHRDFGYSQGLVRLGRLDSGVEVLRRPGSISVTIEPAE